MLIATFNSATGWAGKTIDYDDGRFTLEDHGPISVADVLAYDQQGHVAWAYEGLREWVHQMTTGGVATSPREAVLIGTFTPMDGWAGRSVEYSEASGTFTVQDHGSVTALQILKYATTPGHFEWASDKARVLVEGKLDPETVENHHQAAETAMQEEHWIAERLQRTAAFAAALHTSVTPGGVLLATFNPSTAWAGKRITHDGNRFVLEGHGAVSAADVMEYERQGRLLWANDGTRTWVGSLALTKMAQPADGLTPPQADTPPSPSRPTPQTEDAGASWYYVSHGTRVGPLADAHMLQLLAAGDVTNATQVWKPGFGGWVLVGETDLRQTPTSPPPVPGSAVSNSIVWTVAIVPLAVSLFALMFGLFGPFAWPLAFVVLCVNIALCSIDGRILRKAGYDTSTFVGWVFLIPVYLYRRAKALDQGPGYFTTWIVCFVLSLIV